MNVKSLQFHDKSAFENDPRGNKLGAWLTPSVVGKAIYCYIPGSEFRWIEAFDLDLKKVINRLDFPKGKISFGAFVFSPSGDQLVIPYWEDEPNPGYGFMTMSPSGEDIQDLFRLPEGESFNLRLPPFWLPGSQSIFFSTFKEEIQKFWLISAEGGPPRELDLNFKDNRSIYWITIHPSGREIAFVRRTVKSDIMAMENFLPEIKKNK